MSVERKIREELTYTTKSLQLWWDRGASTAWMRHLMFPNDHVIVPLDELIELAKAVEIYGE